MSITRAKLLEKQAFTFQEPGAEAPKTGDINPRPLLESLKEKYSQFLQLKNEGLINKDKHLHIEQKLKATIEELEELIPQLEVS